MSLSQAIQFTLVSEGGYTVDDGGDTMYGVTQSTYDQYRNEHGLPKQWVKKITLDEVENIMQFEYWTPAGCGLLNTKLGIAHFDWAYNHGVHGAVMDLQSVLGITADGIIGPETTNAFKNANDSIVAPYLQRRVDTYKELATVNPAKYGEYLDGWLNRVDRLRAYLGPL